jgi:uncharacterized membrane protein YciS (DUF1049 family)
VTTADITRQAREIHPGRVLLSGIAAVLFALGWIIGKTFMAVWFIAMWMFVATREGWRTAKVNDEPGRPG